MPVSDPQELVDTLISQHALLRTDLAYLAESAEEWNIERIHQSLSKFKEDILIHWKLENETFYVDFLDKEMKAGEDTEKLKEFIKQMGVIGKVVMSFFDSYLTPDSLDTISPDEFKKRLSGMTDMLKVRLEAEETDVYRAYLAM